MKKFLKVFSVLSVICCSLFVFTGCTITLSEEQKQKVMTVVDNADVFMEDVLENLDKSNSKLGREESYKMLQNAQTRLLLNVGDVWSNMKITGINPYGSSMTNICKVYDGMYVCCETEIENDEVISRSVSFSDIKSNNPCATSVYFKSKEGGTWSEYGYKDLKMHFGNRLNSSYLLAELDFTVDDILFTGVKENGNNYLTMMTVYEQEAEHNPDIICYNTTFVEVEIKDGLFQSITMYLGTTDIKGDPYEGLEGVADILLNPMVAQVVYEYGNADVSNVELMYEQAKEYLENH